MNFSEAVKALIYDGMINVSLAEWSKDIEKVISQLEIGASVIVWVGDSGVADIWKSDDRFYIIMHSEKVIPLEWFHKKWLYFWQALIENGYAFRSRNNLPFSSYIMGPEEYFSHYREEDIVINNEEKMMQICFTFRRN